MSSFGTVLGMEGRGTNSLKSVLPHLLPFNGVNPHGVLLMDNASIHRIDRVISLIQSTGALMHLSPHTPQI